MSRILIAVLILFSNNVLHAAEMKTWNCEASVDSSMIHSEGYYSFLMEDGKDYAWWTLKEGIEDAFDKIANNAAYDPCFLNKVESVYSKLPNSMIWTTEIHYTTSGRIQIQQGFASVPQTSEFVTEEYIQETRSNFSELAQTGPLCNLEGDCSVVSLCSYTCSYGE
jgi:hypothetical protein